MRQVNVRGLAFLIMITLGVGCTATPRLTSRNAMPTQTPPLVGNWEKITDSPCSQTYPDTLEFRERGLYAGHQQAPGAFTLWDAGTFQVAEPGQIRISTANDAIISYQFSLVDDELTFTDPGGCEYKYRRVR